MRYYWFVMWVTATSVGNLPPDHRGCENLKCAAETLRTATSTEEMDDLVAKVNRSKIEFTDDLARILTSPVPTPVKVRACYLLGAFGEGRAVAELIDNIALEADIQGENTRRSLWGRFPCKEALAKIGKPAEPGLIRVLSHPPSDVVRDFALDTLLLIERCRGAVLVLEDAYEGANTEQRRALDWAIARTKEDGR